MSPISKFIKTELSHFKSLPPSAQKLIISFSLYKIAYPFLYTFITAYLLRKTGSFTIIALYNLGIVIALPIGFYINGLLLSKLTVNKLYLISSVAQGLVVIPLFFIESISSSLILLYGLLFGIFFGFWWSNRHYMSLYSMTDDKRNYFEGISTSIDTLIKIAIPAMIGWFIVAGGPFNLYTPEIAYKILIFVATVILFIAGNEIKNVSIAREPIKLFLKNVSSRWSKMRYMSFFNGLRGGAYFYIPTLVILTLIGKEATLGSLLSISAILTAIVTYIVGRRASSHHRFSIMAIGFIILAIGSVILNVNFALLGGIVFIMLYTVSSTLELQTSLPIMYQTIEVDSESDNEHNYARICDIEFFLNAGRIAGILFFIYIAHLSSEIISLKVTVLLAIFFQLISTAILYKMINHQDPFSEKGTVKSL